MRTFFLIETVSRYLLLTIPLFSFSDGGNEFELLNPIESDGSFVMDVNESTLFHPKFHLLIGTFANILDVCLQFFNSNSIHCNLTKLDLIKVFHSADVMDVKLRQRNITDCNCSLHCRSRDSFARLPRKRALIA